MNYFSVSQEQIKQFGRDGFLMVERLFDAREIGLLEKIARADKEKASQVNTARDARGGESRLWLSSETGREDIYNGFCHGRRIINTMEKLLDDEVYLYHYKMIDKEPRVGGAWEWHQDYGYWYNKKCLFPDMASCMIAVDYAHRGNGCFQVMRGSHKLGRIEHGTYGTQAGADPERVALAAEHLDHVYCEMEPGTALFFHANLLHRSDNNESGDPRLVLICCYNTRHNPCQEEPGHPSYTPLIKWEDSQILELGERQWAEMQNSS